MPGKNKEKCVSIQDGTLVYSVDHYLTGQPLTTGFDIFGYNYQAHMFLGSYSNVYLGADGLPPYEGNDEEYLKNYPSAQNKWYWRYRNDRITMKWNDAWLSNKDCNNDGSLDRPENYIGSGAWITNHLSYNDNGVDVIYFVKIVAVPLDAILGNTGIWYTKDGTEIGTSIWGNFAVVEEVYRGSGKFYLSPAAPGFGKWK